MTPLVSLLCVRWDFQGWLQCSRLSFKLCGIRTQPVCRLLIQHPDGKQPGTSALARRLSAASARSSGSSEARGIRTPRL